MPSKHPNQSFIDNFHLPNEGRPNASTFVYSKKYTENKRKEKFQCFLESVNNPKPKSKSAKVAELAKIFEYNTLSKSTKKEKVLLEETKELGNLPANFTYNGLLYSFMPELNMFVNQYEHAISISQASAFAEMAEFDPVESFEADEDGGHVMPPAPVQETLPNTPTGFTASNITSSTVDLGWTDTATNEQGFKVFYRIPPVYPQAPTNLFNSKSILGVSLGWTDNATNEAGFKIFFREIL